MKDAVSYPGVNLHYLLRETIELGAEPYSPCKEAYAMLKEAVVGRQSLMSKRCHGAGVTRIKPHRFERARVCKQIIAYDASVLYLSTMLRDIPCGRRKRVMHYRNQVGAALTLTEQFAEADIEIPNFPWLTFEEMPPFFLTKQTKLYLNT